MSDPSATPQIADSLLDLIGDTPLVRLNRVTEGLACTIAAKLEMLNPGGSVKDRPALAMIDQAERDGLLQPGGTIVEPTSGNTGVGLAIVAAQRGYDCIFVVTDKVAPEKVRLLRGLRRPRSSCARWPSSPTTRSRTTRWPSGWCARRPAPSGPTSTATSGTRGPTSRRPAPRSGARPPAASPTSWPASAPAARSPASAATSRPRTRTCRSWAPTPPARCTRAGRGGPTWSRASARTSGPPPTTPRWSTGWCAVTDEDSFLMARRVTARGGPAHRRVGRHRGGRRPRGRRATSGPTTWWSC